MTTDDDTPTWEEWLAMPSDEREPYELTGKVEAIKEASCNHYFNVEPDDPSIEDIHDTLERLEGKRVLITIDVLD